MSSFIFITLMKFIFITLMSLEPKIFYTIIKISLIKPINTHKI